MKKYALTDIHGCIKTLRKMLEEVLPIHTDTVYYFLGDYINKGPESKATLDYLINFAKNNDCVFLRGNHEQLVLDAQLILPSNESKLSQIEPILKSFGINKLNEMPQKYLDFIIKMKHFHVLNHCLLVHAGFNFENEDIFDDKLAMLNTKNMIYDAIKANGKTIIHGHVPCNVAQLKNDIAAHAPIISLDTGCVYSQNPELNTLTAIDLDTFQCYFQQNIDGDYDIGKR